MEIPSEISNNLVENSAVSPGVLEEILPTITTQTTAETDTLNLKDSLNSSNLNEISETDALLVNESGLLLEKNIIPSPNNLSNNQQSTSNKDPLTGTTETEINNNQKDPLINPKAKEENLPQFDYINQSLSTQNTLINQEPPTIKESQTTNTEKIQTSPETTLKTTNQTPQTTKTLNLNEENIKGGYFTVEETDIIKIDYLFDGGFYQGELAVFSLAGLQNSNLTIEQFIIEAARRALSNTEEGYIIISDSTEGAKFNGIIPGEKDWNTGLYKGEKTLKMQSGDKFAFMLVPNGTVQQIKENPKLGGAIRPLFSLATANPSEAFHLGQIAGINGNTFVMEDRRVDKDSDRDYNDFSHQ